MCTWYLDFQIDHLMTSLALVRSCWVARFFSLFSATPIGFLVSDGCRTTVEQYKSGDVPRSCIPRGSCQGPPRPTTLCWGRRAVLLIVRPTVRTGVSLRGRG